MLARARSSAFFGASCRPAKLTVTTAAITSAAVTATDAASMMGETLTAAANTGPAAIGLGTIKFVFLYRSSNEFDLLFQMLSITPYS